MKNLKKSKKKSEIKETLNDVLERLEIPEDYDYLIFGDGSGLQWKDSVGWASVSIERLTDERRVWVGSMNHGTVNVAEIMAYLQPLSYFLSTEQTKRDNGEKIKTYKVHIITDSDYCRFMGNSFKGKSKVKNPALWSAFEIFKRYGFVLFWHWIPRASCDLNIYCDDLSRMARTHSKGYNIRSAMEPGVYGYDP